MKRAIDDYILAKYFDETANTDELAQISDWLEHDQENHNLLKSYQKIWTATNKEVKDFQPDVEVAWEKVNGKIFVKKAKPNYLRIAAGLAAVILLSTYIFIKNNQPISYLSLKSEKASEVKTLADGSTVTLNSFSLLEYPEKFGEEERRIKLIGEAFFDISKNPGKPFIIEANGTEIRVLGTSFNISARDQNVKVSVNSGTVEFVKTKEKKVILQKGDEALYDSIKDTIKAAPIIDRNIFAYKTKVFEFNDTHLEEVVRILNTGYQSDIKLDGQNWSDYVLTTRFENENLSDALNIIAETLELQLRNRDKSYILAKKAE
ncbi:MAG: transmembrane sensor [Arcticibacterium sp.]|jgi:transmembrane sensor